MYRNLFLAERKQQALQFLTAEMSRLCHSVNLDELDLVGLENLVWIVQMSPDDISYVIHDRLLDGKKQYIGAYYMQDDRRMQEFLNNPYNSVVFSMACDNIDVYRAIAIWESLNKRYLSDTEKHEVEMILTPLMQACSDDLHSRCN